MLKIESNDTYFSADFCDSCKGAPAAFLCKADSASLCAACDAEIHSANPLAGRHHRVPIEPNWGGGFLNGEDEVGSWLLMKGGEEVDEYLELDDQYKLCQHDGDSVVPIEYDHHSFHSELDAGSYGYPAAAASISQTVSISSMEVPVESTLWHRPPKGTIDLFSSPAVPPIEVLSPRDREARVMRYREKKKNRKFEKTIRYASRKAYAESRPRIKGRFAKRNSGRDRDHPQLEVDHIFSSHVDTLYGVVPSF